MKNTVAANRQYNVKYLAVIILFSSTILHVFVSLSYHDTFTFRQKTDAHQQQNLILSKYLYAHQTIESMDLNEKTGQTLFISISGTTLTEQTQNLLRQVKPGGIILFAPNIHTEEQTKKLTTDLQEYMKERGLPPLFIAVDEEGGVVERISFAPVKHTQPQLGKLDEEAITRQTTVATSQILSNLGINTNFAPVSDIAFSDKSIMAERSFGNTPALVSKHVEFEVEEYDKAGIFSTVKHFPGHGRTPADSHQILPVIDLSKTDWDQNERIPFETAIDVNVPFIMVGHLIYPQIDSEMTSTSSKWITEILRGEIGYQGLIIADDVKMGAVGIGISGTGTGTARTDDYLLDTGCSHSATTSKMLDAGNNMVIAVLDQDSLISLAGDIKERYGEKETGEVLSERVLRVLVVKYGVATN